MEVVVVLTKLLVAELLAVLAELVVVVMVE